MFKIFVLEYFPIQSIAINNQESYQGWKFKKNYEATRNY